jgi:hypothetical protein
MKSTRQPFIFASDGLNAYNNSSWVVIDDGQTWTINITFRDPVIKDRIAIMSVICSDQGIVNLSFISGFANVMSHGNRSRYWQDHPRNGLPPF